MKLLHRVFIDLLFVALAMLFFAPMHSSKYHLCISNVKIKS